MAPSNPKRPPRPPRPPGAPASKKEDVELPFDDDEVAPLQEDDPRPQRVPQFPAGPRRSARGGVGSRGMRDRELATRFDTNEYSDPGYAPAFLYVEKGPGAGQLIPVKQGPLVIGRASACDLRLQHPSISRRHAQLMRTSERFVLRDLGSQNGTFVNRVKLTGDMEVRPGDEISLGNALLKLRAAGGAPGKAPEAHGPARTPTRMAMSLTRVALVAAAVGSAVAALLTLAFLKATGASEDSAGASLDTSSGAYVPPPEVPPEEATADSNEPNERALKPLQPQANTPDGKSPGPRATAVGSKSSTPRKEPGARTGAQASKSSSRQGPAATVDRAEILARYEKGEVDAALALAREGQLEPLASQLAAFQSALAEGQRALTARETASAIRHLSSALALDQELSQGWSVQARKLRKQLGHLYTLTGTEQLKAGSISAARESFETALKYDGSNTRALKELQQLGGKQ
jgi:hypothetical protein